MAWTYGTFYMDVLELSLVGDQTQLTHAKLKPSARDPEALSDARDVTTMRIQSIFDLIHIKIRGSNKAHCLHEPDEGLP